MCTKSPAFLTCRCRPRQSPRHRSCSARRALGTNRRPSARCCRRGSAARWRGRGVSVHRPCVRDPAVLADDDPRRLRRRGWRRLRVLRHHPAAAAMDRSPHRFLGVNPPLRLLQCAQVAPLLVQPPPQLLLFARDDRRCVRTPRRHQRPNRALQLLLPHLAIRAVRVVFLRPTEIVGEGVVTVRHARRAGGLHRPTVAQFRLQQRSQRRASAAAPRRRLESRIQGSCRRRRTRRQRSCRRPGRGSQIGGLSPVQRGLRAPPLLRLGFRRRLRWARVVRPLAPRLGAAGRGRCRPGACCARAPTYRARSPSCPVCFSPRRTPAPPCAPAPARAWSCRRVTPPRLSSAGRVCALQLPHKALRCSPVPRARRPCVRTARLGVSAR